MSAIPQPPAPTPQQPITSTTVTKEMMPKPNPIVAILSAPSLLTLIALVGLIVLVALNKVTADVAVPVISGLAGVHIGAQVTS
jgi:hypothetical protein